MDTTLGTTSMYVEGVHILMNGGFPFDATPAQRGVFNGFIQQGCDIIISGSSLLSDVSREFALQHPSVTFLVIGGYSYIADLPNAAIVYNRQYQAKYAAGVAAASTPGVEKLGYIGSLAFSDPVPDSAYAVNAFLLGARSVNSSMEVDTIYTGSWYDPRSERIAALRLWQTHGANVVTYDSDSDTTCEVSNELGQLPPLSPVMYSIGHKTDGGLKHSAAVLTSTTLVWNRVLEELVSAVMDGTWNSSLPDGTLVKDMNAWVGFEKSAVGIGVFSQHVPYSARNAVKDVVSTFSQGTFADNVFCPPGGSYTDTNGVVRSLSDDPEAANGCFSPSYVTTSMTYWVQGVNFIGMLDVPNECPPGSYMDPLADSLCVACPVGTFTDAVEQAECQRCPPGRFNDELNATVCQACAPGRFQNATGATDCLPCPEGTFSDGSALECTPCPLGTFRNEIEGALVTSCAYCERGRYASNLRSTECASCPALMTTENIASSGSSDCMCDFGAYGMPGAGICTACPALATTRRLASQAVEACECARDTYMSSSTLTCTACPAGSMTTGEGKTDIASCLCNEGTYRPLGVASCKTCPEGMVCPRGSAEANQEFINAANKTEEQVFMALDEGYFSTRSEPMSVFECSDLNRCPGGNPGDCCAERLHSLSCAFCEDEWRWNGVRCVRCTSVAMSRFLFIALPVLLCPVLVLGLYRMFGDPILKWGSLQNAVACIAYIALNHYQFLDIMQSANVKLPAAMENSGQVWAVTNNAFALFDLSCAGILSFSDTMLLRGISPLVFAASCAVVLLVSRVMHGSIGKCGIDANRLQNVLGSVMFTFFSGIAASSFLLFKCSPNPNGKNTLYVDASIVCYESDEWMNALGVAIVCLSVYCLGMGSLFVSAIVMASFGNRFRDPGFQMRWKFLFIKFRADRYWWSLVLLLKNLLLNLAFAIFREGRRQLFVLMFVCAAYLIATSVFMPYRYRLANLVEIFASVALIVCAGLLTSFADAKELEDRKSAIATTSQAVSFTPLVLSAATIAFLVHRHMKREKFKEDSEVQSREVLLACQRLAVLDDEGISEVWDVLTEWDRFFMAKAAEVVLTSVTDEGSRGSMRLSDGMVVSRYRSVRETARGKTAVPSFTASTELSGKASQTCALQSPLGSPHDEQEPEAELQQPVHRAVPEPFAKEVAVSPARTVPSTPDGKEPAPAHASCGRGAFTAADWCTPSECDEERVCHSMQVGAITSRRATTSRWAGASKSAST